MCSISALCAQTLLPRGPRTQTCRRRDSPTGGREDSPIPDTGAQWAALLPRPAGGGQQRGLGGQQGAWPRPWPCWTGLAPRTQWPGRTEAPSSGDTGSRSLARGTDSLLHLVPSANTAESICLLLMFMVLESKTRTQNRTRGGGGGPHFPRDKWMRGDQHGDPKWTHDREHGARTQHREGRPAGGAVTAAPHPEPTTGDLFVGTASAGQDCSQARAELTP